MRDFIWETLKVIVVSLAIIIPVRYFLIQPFYVKGASMESNFYDHEYLIVDEISYRFNEPERGDVVVFKYPYDRSQYFIKRIIGLPGETVLIKDGKIIISDVNNVSGFVLREDLYLQNTYTQGNESIELNEDEYFIMGDNRSASLDSRMFGPIKKSDIVGRAWIRGWPIERMKVFNDPVY
ncbi:signal peptidase I [Candidatus Kuenenbacteria bacterium CG1_02_38_13]|uniref:Signal peptidase I n=1 Tax=Candidatus Kuenenbacteria bacterium CG1_02_38_13 TaxID=1805235 RepID=A0A1J4TX38_9BACT|nr:MAG: signal peptidase I [Candidatus Kuenenbacteria bacterium CG1_02_38_13]